MGAAVTIGLGAAAFAYSLLTWSEPHRWVLVAISLGAVADGIMFALLRRRIACSGAIEAIFFAWNVAHVLASGVASYLDGGPDSPFTAVLFVSIVFAAVSIARTYVWAIALIDIATLLAVAGLAHAWDATVVLLAPALVAVGVVGAAVAGEQQARLVAVQEARTEMLQRLARVIEFRDIDTGTHVERMGEYCALIARQLGWPEGDIDRLRAAAPMHDIGKVAVPDQILLKPGPLTQAERLVMQRHTTVGFQMLAGSSSAEIELGAEIALTHHEHFDGGGYPNGLSGADIPVAGRIVAVADVFDALTSHRVYRQAIAVGDALQIVHEGRARQFDPKVLDAFEDALEDILSARMRNRQPAPVAQLRTARSPESARA